MYAIIEIWRIKINMKYEIWCQSKSSWENDEDDEAEVLADVIIEASSPSEAVGIYCSSIVSSADIYESKGLIDYYEEGECIVIDGTVYWAEEIE